MELTPGMCYVGRWILSPALPVVALFLLLARFLQAVGVSLSVGGATALFIVISLAISIGSILLAEVSQRHRAAAHGARLIPRVKGYLPGNVDVLFDSIWRTEMAYIGDPKSNLIKTGANEGGYPLLQAPSYERRCCMGLSSTSDFYGRTSLSRLNPKISRYVVFAQLPFNQ